MGERKVLPYQKNTNTSKRNNTNRELPFGNYHKSGELG